MTPHQIAQVQSSFAKVAPIAEQAAAIFYDRLFVMAPAFRAMFPADMREQRKKLTATLGVVVGGLGDLGSVLPAATTLARKHVGYGVKPEHYAVVGGALLYALEQGLANDWTAELADAWSAAYALLSDYMIAEAYGAPATA